MAIPIHPKGVLFATAVVASTALWSATAPAEIRLDRDSDIVIRESGDYDTASGCLTDLLERNLRIILNKERLPGPGNRVEFLLETEAARWQDLPRDSRTRLTQIDAFTIDIRSAPAPRVTIRGRTPVATGYGVLCFLEEELRMHWAFPGELGCCPPKSDSFYLAERTIQREPAVVGRALSGLLLRDDAPPDRGKVPVSGVLRENREFFLASDYFKSLRMRAGSVTHNMLHLFPAAWCLETHPEILPRRADGSMHVPTVSRGGRTERDLSQAWHPCYTNPQTLQIALAEGREQFDAGRLFFSLGINDGRRIQCQCEACRRAGWPESYYQFVTQVAERLRTEYPAQLVGVLAYGDVGIPPDTLRLPANVLVNIAGMRKDVWEDKTPNLGVYEYLYGAGFTIPNLPLDVLQENFAYYTTHRLMLYRAEFYPLWAFDAPKAYIVRKMLWHPQQDVRTLLREYCSRTFGDGGPAMYDFYEYAGSWRTGDAAPGSWTPLWGKVWPFQEPFQFQRCPADYHATLFSHLQRAGTAELTEAERKRVEMVQAFTQFSATYYAMWRLKERVFLGRPTPEDGQRAKSLQATAADLMAELAGRPQWFLGSSVKADSLHAREWPTAPLEQQMETVQTTAAWSNRNEQRPSPVAGGNGTELLPLRRGEHSWYKTWQSQPLEIESRIPGGFSFLSRANEAIQNDDDPRYNGNPKFQWLHAKSRDIDPRSSGVLVATVQVQGRHGILQVELAGSTRSDETAKAILGETVIEFGEQESSEQVRVAIDPTDWGNGLGKTNLQLRLLWKPLQGDATLRGTAGLTGG
jgi:hypothetical protein